MNYWEESFAVFINYLDFKTLVKLVNLRLVGQMGSLPQLVKRGQVGKPEATALIFFSPSALFLLSSLPPSHQPFPSKLGSVDVEGGGIVLGPSTFARGQEEKPSCHLAWVGVGGYAYSGKQQG